MIYRQALEIDDKLSARAVCRAVPTSKGTRLMLNYTLVPFIVTDENVENLKNLYTAFISEQINLFGDNGLTADLAENFKSLFNPLVVEIIKKCFETLIPVVPDIHRRYIPYFPTIFY